MAHGPGTVPAPETVPLQNAVLCVDCELVTMSRGNQCPVCGGRALLSLASVIGGTVVDYRASHEEQPLFQFDLRVNIDMMGLDGAELSSVVEGLGRVVAPRVGRGRASLHMTVEPVAKSVQLAKMAA
jgi:hypothetical protein